MGGSAAVLGDQLEGADRRLGSAFAVRTNRGTWPLQFHLKQRFAHFSWAVSSLANPHQNTWLK